MKEVFLLTKILLKNSMNSNKQDKQKKRNPLKLLGWVLLYLYIAGIVGFFSFEAISALKTIHQEAVFLNLCLVIVLGFTIMRSLFTSMNVLFFSKDIEYLLPLPVKPYKIVMAKINCMIISEYIMCLLIVLPVLIVYGYLLQTSILFYLVGICVMLIFPIVPIMIVSLFTTIVMKFFNFVRNKDLVQYITVILTLIFIIGIEFLIGGTNENMTEQQFASMLVQTNGLVEMYTKSFMTLKPAMQALIGFNTAEGLLQLGLLFFETISIYVVVIGIMSKFYIKTVTNTTSSSIFTKKKESNLGRLKISSEMKAYVKKEFQILVRNPIFFMQCIMPSLLFPLIFGISIYMGLNSSGEIAELEQMKIAMQNGMGIPSGVAICVAILIFFYMFNFISITSVSRDGENAIFMKYIPISLEKQCFYKILPGIIMNIVPIIYMTIVVKLLYPNIPSNILIYINVLAILINILNNYCMILIDLNKPKLHWTTEYTVVKQNMNMLWEMVIYLIEIGIIVFLGFFIQSIEIFSLLLSMICLIGIKMIKKWMNQNQNQLFEKIM